MILKWRHLQRKAGPAGADLPVFLFSFLRFASGRRPENKKTGRFAPGFFFIAECDEISNLNLMRDIVGITRLQEFLQLRK